MSPASFPLLFCDADQDFIRDPTRLFATKSWLDEQFGERVPFNASWLIYTDVDGHSLELVWDDGETCQLQIQVRLETCSMAFTRQVCLLAAALGYALFSPEFETVLAPEAAHVHGLMPRSEAWCHALESGAIPALERGLDLLAFAGFGSVHPRGDATLPL